MSGIQKFLTVIFTFIIAIALIIYSTVATSTKKKAETQTSVSQSLENDEEARLSAILSNLEGAGKVRTMITASDGEITGVLVVADGAKNPMTRLKLMQACASALGISEDIVCVLCKQN